eukprot:CAMPEP_0195301724 /NCGR_PEP_ID=MMETSP0707-20130614/29819_1 /TAXON_ID=33640 /ORGANISM="Asterionellopsis glacialis, Strain CCMP134" /LENGTH=733 /DNA_ID=CAMNT_0040364761 /DNA_START=132 /DNA_END=2333 /DNA_ORIENTATION=+
MNYNNQRTRKTNGRCYRNNGNDAEDDSVTHASMANAVVDMVLGHDDNNSEGQQHDDDDEKAEEKMQLEKYHQQLEQRQRRDQISAREKNTTRTSSTRKIAAHIKKNHKKIHPIMPNTNSTNATKPVSVTSKIRKRQEVQQEQRSQSNHSRLNLVDIDIEEKVGVSYHHSNNASASLHKMTSEEEKMLQEKIAGILVATNKDTPNGKEQLSPLYFGETEKSSSPSRSTSAPPDLLQSELAGPADGEDDNDMIPPPLRRHAQSLPGAVRIRGPGYVEADSPDDTNSILSQIVASVTPAATRAESERFPNNENGNNNNDGGDSDGSESDEENLINAVLVDTDDFVEATIMPEPRKRKCRNLLCGLMVIGMAVVLAGLLPMIYEKVENRGKTLPSSDAVNVESDKDVGDGSSTQTLSPSPSGTAQEKFVTDVDTLAPTTTPTPTASPSKVPTSFPTTSKPTSMPSITPTMSPTVSVTITVVIQLDDRPEQTGWSLKCDGQTYFHIPPKTYENDVNRQIVVLGQTYSGANCELGIIDTGFDGIADGSYAVYYGDDITDPSYRLVDGWGSSFERDLKVPFVVAAPPTMSPTTSLTPTQSPAPSVQPGLGLPAINMVPVTVEIQLDYFAAEISWALQCGDETVASYGAGTYTTPNALVRETYEIQEGKECQFGILDQYGDGICCVYGNGYYSINVGNDFTNEDNIIVYGTLYVGVGQREESFTVMEPISSGPLFKSLPNP